MVPLEELFDHNDVEKFSGMVPNGTKVDDYNIGIDEDPKIINIYTNFSSEEKEKYLCLLK